MKKTSLLLSLLFWAFSYPFIPIRRFKERKSCKKFIFFYFFRCASFFPACFLFFYSAASYRMAVPMARQNPRAEPQYVPTCLLHSLAYRNHFPIHALNLLRFSDYTKAHLHRLVFLVCKPDSSRLQSIDSAA